MDGKLLSARQTSQSTHCVNPFIRHSRKEETTEIKTDQKVEGRKQRVEGQEEHLAVMEMMCIFIVAIAA